MNKHTFARIVSFALHPVIFAILVPFLVVYKDSANILYGLKWTFFSSFFLFLAAGLFFILYPKKRFGDIDRDFDISHKENRHIFYSICAFIAIIFFIISALFKGFFFPLSIVALGMLFGIILFDLVNYYLKISVHVAVVTAYVFTFYVLYGFLPFLGVVWVWPVIVWARLHLKKHTKKEALAGAVLGGLIVLITVFIGRQLSL